MRRARWPTLRKTHERRYRSLEERARAVELACRTAVQLVEHSPDRESRLARIDPVPPSTRELLRRLARRANA